MYDVFSSGDFVIGLNALASFIASFIASVIFSSFTGTNSSIFLSFTIESCTKLSTSGRANDALTGVTKSIQYDDNLGVKNGI